MIKIPQNPVYVVINTTATDDNVFQVTTLDLWFKELDVFVYDNDCYMGDIGGQDVTIYTNDVYTIKGYVNAGELFFKNLTAGSDTQITIAGVQISDKEKREAGLV